MPGYNFTEDVRTVLARAREEANLLQHEYVGTEHILLGYASRTDTPAARLLKRAGAQPDQVRAAIEGIIKPGRSPDGTHDLPYTSRAKKILELAMTEARGRRHDYVGIEHLLLAMIREQLGIAAQVLAAQGVRAEAVSAQIPGVYSSDESRHAGHGELMMLPPQGDHVRKVVRGGGAPRMRGGVVLALAILWVAVWVFLRPEIRDWRLLALLLVIVAPPLLLWRFTRR